MEKRGTVIRWNEEKAYGFIRSDDSHADVFFHLRDLQRGTNQVPAVGMTAVFQEIHVGGKGPRAVSVRLTGKSAAPAATTAATPRTQTTPPLALEPMRRPATAPRNSNRMDWRRIAAPRKHRDHSRPRNPSASPAPAANLWVVPLAIAHAVFIGWCIWKRFLPAWVAGVLVGINVVTFMRYWFDKYAASRRQWRTPESKLHFWSVAGGWPAAWLAQQVLRHKSSKPDFLAVYCATVFLNLAAWGGWYWLDHVQL